MLDGLGLLRAGFWSGARNGRTAVATPLGARLCRARVATAVLLGLTMEATHDEGSAMFGAAIQRKIFRPQVCIRPLCKEGRTTKVRSVKTDRFP